MELSHSFDTITSPPPPSPPGHTPSTPCPPLTCPSTHHPTPSTPFGTKHLCQGDNQAVLMSPTMTRSNTIGRANTIGRCSTMKRLQSLQQCNNMNGFHTTLGRCTTMGRSSKHAPSYCSHTIHNMNMHGENLHCDQCGTLAFPDPPTFIPRSRRNFPGVRSVS